AMTGEITLRGRVLPIGGLKEKVLAAHRGGVKTVLIPKENEKDIQDIPQQITKNISLVQVEHMDQVLREALVLADPESFFKPLPPDELAYSPSTLPDTPTLIDEEEEDEDEEKQ